MTLPRDIEHLALLGWRLFPSTRSRKGMFKGYGQAATADLDTLERWAHEYPGCNWSVIPEGSGIWALDVDVPSPDHAADGVAALRDLTALHGPLPPRPHGRSGGGGHLLVFTDTGAAIRTKTGTPAPGIDPRAGRVSFTVAPSRHRNGRAYRWVVAPWELNPPPAPDWLLQLLAPPPAKPLPPRPFIPTTDAARRALDRAYSKVTSAEAGTRNATLNAAAFRVGRWIGAGLLHEREAADALYSAGRAAGLEDVEIRDTLRSGFTAGAARPVEARA